MTTVAFLARDTTSPLRAAGKLFVVAGFTTPVSVGLEQFALSMKAPPDIYVYGPAIVVALAAAVVGLVAGVSYLVAFVLLFSWRPGLRQLIFFGPALGGLLGVASFALDNAAVLVVGVFLSLLAVLSGFLVFQQRIFLTAGSIVFLLTMIVSQAPAVAETIDPSNSGLSFGLRYGVGGCYLVCGFVMLAAARARARLIADGLSEY